MKYILSFFALFLTLLFCSQAQNPIAELQGVVTFVTSQNVYVKFDQTDEIQVGDTLRLAASTGPCLKVTNKSSSSCVCVPLQGCEVKKDDVILFSPRPEEVLKEEVEEKETPISDPVPTPEPVAEEEVLTLYKEKIRGRISASSYSNMASMRDNRHRFMGRLSLDAKHINNSKLSFETYLSYRQINPVNPTEFKPQTSFFRVFDLALTYDALPDLSLTLGRKINPKIASLGAIDGLQAEKRFGNAYVGAIVGSRPDISTFSFNPNLLEYGAYGGIRSRSKSFYAQTTVGFIQQQNAGKVDRRYAYFQHASTIAKNLSLFSSMELDLYSAVNGTVTNSTRLTNLYLSGTYRFGRKVRFMLSYDTRRRILYYETFQTEIERLLNDDLARQGLRARINVRPVKYVNVGISYSQRFQSNQQNKSDNVHFSASWARIPTIGGRLYFTYNINNSNYLSSNILSVRHSRSLIKNKLNATVYYRMADYVFINSTKNRRQNYVGGNLSVSINKKLAFSVAGEVSNFNQESNYRVYARIIRRFYGKKKP